MNRNYFKRKSPDEKHWDLKRSSAEGTDRPQLGDGTKENPAVYVEVGHISWAKTAELRRRANMFIAWATSKALGWSRITIRSFNHSEARGYNENNKPLYERDRNGYMKRKMVSADSHLTVTFWDQDMNTYFSGHIYTKDYTVGEEKNVPLRPLLIKERRYTRANDKESPQLWPYTNMEMWKEELETSSDVTKRWVMAKSDQNCPIFDFTTDLSRLSKLDEIRTYQKRLDELTEEQVMQWAGVPRELVEPLLRGYKSSGRSEILCTLHDEDNVLKRNWTEEEYYKDKVGNQGPAIPPGIALPDWVWSEAMGHHDRQHATPRFSELVKQFNDPANIITREDIEQGKFKPPMQYVLL